MEKNEVLLRAVEEANMGVIGFLFRNKFATLDQIDTAIAHAFKIGNLSVAKFLVDIEEQHTIPNKEMTNSQKAKTNDRTIAIPSGVYGPMPIQDMFDIINGKNKPTGKRIILDKEAMKALRSDMIRKGDIIDTLTQCFLSSKANPNANAADLLEAFANDIGIKILS